MFQTAAAGEKFNFGFCIGLVFVTLSMALLA